MAIQWADSFSRYGTDTPSISALTDGTVYSNMAAGTNARSGQCVTDPDPNVPTGSTCLRLGDRIAGNGWSTSNRIALPTPTSGVIGVACRMWFGSTPTSSSQRPSFIQVRTVDNDLLILLRMEQNGSVTVSGGTSTGDTIIPVITLNAWNHYELKYDCGTGAGEFYVNGVKRLDFTDGGTGTAAIICFGRHSGATSPDITIYMKDLVIWDGTGSENNDVMGSVKVSRRKPVSDVTIGGWVPSTGSTGWDLLAKDAPDDNTYLTADDAPPSPMQFNFENLPDDTTSVRAILTVARMRKVDGGDAFVQMSVSPDGTNWDDGEDRPISSAFAYWFDVSQVSPATAAAWTPQEFNDIIGEVNRTI